MPNLQRFEDGFRRSVTRNSAIWFGILVITAQTSRMLAGQADFAMLWPTVNFVLAALTLAIPLLLHWRVSIKVCGTLLVVCLNGVALASCIANGGMRAPASILFVLTPVFGFLCVGTIAARVAFGLSLLSMSFIVLAEHQGWTTQLLDPERHAALKAMIFAFCAGATYGVGAIYERMRGQNEKCLKDLIAELAATKQDLESAQAAANIGSWHWDLRQNAMVWSPHLYQLLGIESTAIPSFDEYLSHFSSSEQEKTKQALLINPGKNGENTGEYTGEYTVERTLRRRSGELRVVAERMLIEFDAEHKPLHIKGTIQDITERRANEEAVNQHRAILAAKAKMAALGEMAAGLAHEINNPVGIIYGKTQMLARAIEDGSATPERIKADLRIFIATSERISKIVAGLRTFSRDSGRDPLQPERLLDIIQGTLDLCGERLRNHHIDVRVHCDKDISALCIASQISQVLLNLLSNAHDAVESLQEKWIDIRVVGESEWVRIEVTDSGSGIPEAIAEKIMQPFFTTKDVGQGTGLGLSISKGIIENHKGIFAYDPKAPNTRFILTLQGALAIAVAV